MASHNTHFWVHAALTSTAEALQTLLGAEATICMTASEQFLGVGGVDGQPCALIHERLVGTNARPLENAHNIRVAARHQARAVSVFDADEKGATVTTSKEGIVERGAQAAQVEEPCGRWRVAHAHLLEPAQRCPHHPAQTLAMPHLMARRGVKVSPWDSMRMTHARWSYRYPKPCTVSTTASSGSTSSTAIQMRKFATKSHDLPMADLSWWSVWAAAKKKSESSNK